MIRLPFVPVVFLVLISACSRSTASADAGGNAECDAYDQAVDTCIANMTPTQRNVAESSLRAQQQAIRLSRGPTANEALSKKCASLRETLSKNSQCALDSSEPKK